MPEQSSRLSLLVRGAHSIGLDLQTEQLRRFSVLSRELLAWHRRVNLTSVTDPAEIEVMHFLDSLTLVPVVQQFLPEAKGRLVDVGSGGGFPGLAVAIALPWLRVALIEATAKKVRFLEHMTAVLGLSNAQLLHGRAEELAHDGQQREAYDIATARAVGSVATLVELLTPFLRVGGLAVLMKTRSAVASELTAAVEALERLHVEIEEIRDVAAPGLDDRALVLMRKTAATPPEYPRRPGVPGRRPLTLRTAS